MFYPLLLPLFAILSINSGKMAHQIYLKGNEKTRAFLIVSQSHLFAFLSWHKAWCPLLSAVESLLAFHYIWPQWKLHGIRFHYREQKSTYGLFIYRHTCIESEKSVNQRLWRPPLLVKLPTLLEWDAWLMEENHSNDYKRVLWVPSLKPNAPTGIDLWGCHLK